MSGQSCAAGRAQLRVESPMPAIGHRHEQDVGVRHDAPNALGYRLSRLRPAQRPLEPLGCDDNAHGPKYATNAATLRLSIRQAPRLSTAVIICLFPLFACFPCTAAS
jgi:hypothetical protein